jgi:hypothetical protein
MYPQQSQHDEGSTRGGDADLAYRALSILSLCITPFIRTGFGAEGIGMNGLLAAVLLIIVAGSVPDMQLYVALWFGALVIQRAHTVRNKKRGMVTHSRYGGYPWLAMKIPLVRKESTAFLIAEPSACLAVGALIYTASPTFGQFIMVCAVAMFLKYSVENAVTQKRIQRMRDAEIEQRWYAEQFRQGGR